MKSSVDNLKCKKCGLYKKCEAPFMGIKGCGEEPDILVVGDTPNEYEDKARNIFLSNSIEVLKTVLNEFGFEDKNIAWVNAVRCHTKKILKNNINLCREFLLQDIEELKPKYVFLLGNIALESVFDKTGIGKYNGMCVEQDGIIYIPLYHPKFIINNETKLDEWLNCIVEAVYEEETDKKEWEILYPKNLDAFDNMVNDLMQHDVVSFDIETSSLNPFNDDSCILSMSLSRSGVNYTFPLFHKESKLLDIEEIIDTLAYFFVNYEGKLIAHNAKFDVLWIKEHLGFDIDIAGDTMLMHHLLHSNKGASHGLKHLASKYLGMFEYDKELVEYCIDNPAANVRKGGSYANAPLDILLKYGALDTEATLKLYFVLYEKLSEKQKILHDDLLTQTSKVLTEMQFHGFYLDTYIADRYTRLYRFFQESALLDILEDEKVKEITYKRQKAHDKLIEGTKRARKVFEFNPRSSDQIGELYDLYNVPVVEKTATGKRSTSAALYESIEDDFPILKKIRAYKMYVKMLSTYLEPSLSWISKDSCVHANFNLHGTATGRLSSSEPTNLQNLPDPVKSPGTILEYLPIRNLFRSRFKSGYLVTVDYSGMEIRVFASLANCKGMIDIINSGKDFHTMVTSAISGVSYDEVEKSLRRIYKSINFAILYGGDEYTLLKNNIPVEIGKPAIEEYYKNFPEVLEFKQYTRDFVRDNGYIETVFGRREYLYNIKSTDNSLRRRDERVALNMPVQSTASDVVQCALVCLYNEMKKKNMKSILVNSVHDSIVGDCPKNELDDFVNLAIDVMSNVKDYAKVYLPKLDFSWLRVPLHVDADYGTYYGDKIDY